jgi:hypothetical protein
VGGKIEISIVADKQFSQLQLEAIAQVGLKTNFKTT